MAVSTTTYIKDAVLFIRDELLSNLTDPVSAKRSGSEKFVLTSYPRRPVQYPIITVRIVNIDDIRRMGMQSELHFTRIVFEVRIWARNELERDELSQDVINQLRSNQFGDSNASSQNNLHDFLITSTSDVDETGEAGIKSRVIQLQYTYILGE